MKSTLRRNKGKKETGASAEDAQRQPGPHARQAKTDGAAAGLPPFLSRTAEPPLVRQKMKVKPRPTTNPATDTREHEADRAREHVRQGSEGGGVGVTQKVGRVSDGEARIGGLVARRLGASQAGGDPLPDSTRGLMEEKLGADFGGVRVHTDAEASRTAESFKANAFTSGNDIYFNRGVYDPATAEGRGLLAHELTHVVQQKGGSSDVVQFDLQQSMPTTLGGFDIGMVARPRPRPGLDGTIVFHPDPTGPYSAQIGLIQVVNVTDVAGRTAAAGAPVDWSGVGTGAESDRSNLMTTGLDGAPQGWFVDSQTAANTPSSASGPNYIEQWGIVPPRNAFGWLRSPTDLHETSLYDYPWFSFDVDFDFETVAKATDTQTIYGALNWGFGIRSGVVVNEYAFAVDAQSATFDEALERFRGFYTHEPIVIYFDHDDDTPMAGEDAKITGVLDYLSRYPDVRVQLEGFADEHGDVARNLALSRRRAENVRTLAITLGVGAGSIDPILAGGETAAFAAGPDAGALRANRRVVMTFVRTATAPIVMP